MKKFLFFISLFITGITLLNKHLVSLMQFKTRIKKPLLLEVFK